MYLLTVKWRNNGWEHRDCCIVISLTSQLGAIFLVFSLPQHVAQHIFTHSIRPCVKKKSNGHRTCGNIIHP